jgi:hypothetical protein
MPQEDEQRLVIKESALGFRLVSLLLFLVGAAIFYYSGRFIDFITQSSNNGFGIGLQILGVITTLVGLLLLIFSVETIITADKKTRILKLEYRHLYGRDAKIIPFDNLEDILVEYSRSSHMSSNAKYVSVSVAYRLTAILKDGSSLPFHDYYASTYKEKESSYKRKAQTLRKFIFGSQFADEHKLVERKGLN